MTYTLHYTSTYSDRNIWSLLSILIFHHKYHAYSYLNSECDSSLALNIVPLYNTFRHHDLSPWFPRKNPTNSRKAVSFTGWWLLIYLWFRRENGHPGCWKKLTTISTAQIILESLWFEQISRRNKESRHTKLATMCEGCWCFLFFGGLGKCWTFPFFPEKKKTNNNIMKPLLCFPKKYGVQWI